MTCVKERHPFNGLFSRTTSVCCAQL